MSKRTRALRDAKAKVLEEVKTGKRADLPPWVIQNGQPTQEQMAALRGLRFMLAVPMYGGMCMGQFASSLLSLGLWCDRLGIILDFQALYNESLIQRGRNALTYTFMASKSEYLMSIDADITFNPQSVIELLLCAKMANEPLIGATYSKKSINVPAMRRAMEAGVKDEHLLHCAGDHVIRPIYTDGKSTEVKYFEPYAVQYLGTGFMLTHRSVFEKMKEAKKADGTPLIVPYHNNHLRSAPPEALIYPFFDVEARIDPQTGRNILLSEDYLFCANAIDLGYSPKLALWVLLAHNGTFAFEGCFACTEGAYETHGLLNHLPQRPK